MNRSVDRRVRIVAELLRGQEFLPPPGNLHAKDNSDEEDVKENLTDELAREVKLSAVHLRALFRRDMKTTPDRYAKQLKMENAIKLAENSPLTIARIVELVRGGDESHFQRDVKKTYGKTLGDFRRLHIQQTEEEQGE